MRCLWHRQFWQGQGAETAHARTSYRLGRRLCKRRGDRRFAISKTRWTVFIQQVNFEPKNDQPAGERSVAELKAPNVVSKALNAAWVRPFLFLIFIVVIWDLTIRVFRIPAYQIPAPGDVVAVLYSDWPELLRQSWPTTYATICGFLLSAVFGIPVAMLIAGSKTVES
jgi:hypothetical protein